MGLSRDGAFGVLVMHWRRVEIDGRLYVQEQWGSDREGPAYGPFPTEAACTAAIKRQVATVKAAFIAGRRELMGEHPTTILFARAAEDPLEDEAANG